MEFSVVNWTITSQLPSPSRTNNFPPRNRFHQNAYNFSDDSARRSQSVHRNKSQQFFLQIFTFPDKRVNFAPFIFPFSSPPKSHPYRIIIVVQRQQQKCPKAGTLQTTFAEQMLHYGTRGVRIINMARCYIQLRAHTSAHTHTHTHQHLHAFNRKGAR